MATVTNQGTAAYDYAEVNSCALQRLFSFLANETSATIVDIFKTNSLRIEDSKECHIPDVPDAVFLIFSYLDSSKDFSAFIGTNKHFFSIADQMPENVLSSNSIRSFLYARRLFSDEEFKGASQALVQAVANRPLSSEDAYFYLPGCTGKSKQAAHRATRMENRFCAVLKKRCIELGVVADTGKFAIYKACAFNGLNKITSSNICWLQRMVMPFKLSTVCNHVNRNLVLDQS